MKKLALNETSLHVDIGKLMDSYSTDWSKHLEAAPLAINVLGKLAIMSHQKMDIHKNKSKKKTFSRRNIFGTYKFPTRIRNSLLRISNQGNSVFHKAHTNMEKIRMCNSNVSSHFKDVTRYLMSKNHTNYIIEFLPASLQKVQESADKSQELSTEVVKEFKIVLETIEEMMMAIKQMELRRRNTQPIVERNKSLHFTKMYYKEAIKALKIALNELTKLNNAWMKLIEFYSKMSVLISKSTEESKAFVNLVNAIKINTTQLLDDEEIFENLMDSVQKATEASFLVHGVSDMCVDVSEMYIIDQIGNLEYVIKRLQAFIAHAIDNKNEYETLVQQWHIKSGSEGIRYYMEADETLLRDKLVERHNEIVNEYRWMQDCDSEEDRQFV